MKREDFSTEDLLRALDHIHSTICIFDREGRYVFYNQCTPEAVGVAEKVLSNHTIYEMVEQHYISASASVETFLTQKSCVKYSLYHGNAPHLIVSTPILDDSGTLEFVVAYSLDQQMLDVLGQEVAEAQRRSMQLLQRVSTQESCAAQDLIHESPKMRELVDVLGRVAQVDSTILLTGETGVGKDVLAHYVHDCSPRQKQLFIPVNCAAIPDSLIESELFGYSSGTFTGASKNGKAGIFELADGGTIFLDEIGEMPLSFQAKLLRVLETHEVVRLGSVSGKHVDFRLIAATNRNLEAMCQEGRFREDLYYRLNTLEFRVPPLRERREDVVPLAKLFLAQLNKKYQTQKVFSPRTLQFFETYSWPGNIRQLKNDVERLAITAVSNLIEYDQSLPYARMAPAEPAQAAPRTAGPSPILPLKEALRQEEQRLIQSALAACGGNVGKAAQALQIHKTGLYKKLKEYGHQEAPHSPADPPQGGSLNNLT